MKLMKRAVAVALMSLLASGMIACEQKKESTEAPAEKAAPAMEQQAPAADVQAPAQEAQPAMEEEIQPPAEEGLADVPSQIGRASCRERV